MGVEVRSAEVTVAPQSIEINGTCIGQAAEK